VVDKVEKEGLKSWKKERERRTTFSFWEFTLDVLFFLLSFFLLFCLLDLLEQ